MTSEEFEALDEAAQALELSLGGSRAVVVAFEGELKRMQATMADAGRDMGVLSRGISRGLGRALEGLAFDGKSVSDALKGVAESMMRATYSTAMRPVTRHVGGLLAEGVSGLLGGLTPFADGSGFAQGRVMPFASGGVVSGPTVFPMRGGTGLMGEAGPEAILPLSRGADGRLGVRTEGGRAVNVVVNVSTPDVEGFRRSQSQIAAQMERALARGRRNR